MPRDHQRYFGARTGRLRIHQREAASALQVRMALGISCKRPSRGGDKVASYQLRLWRPGLSPRCPPLLLGEQLGYSCSMEELIAISRFLAEIRPDKQLLGLCPFMSLVLTPAYGRRHRTHHVPVKYDTALILPPIKSARSYLIEWFS
jgi:hypothetical protein